MTILEDLRYAGRTFARGRRFALTAAITLALVMGTNAAVFTLWRGVLVRPIEVEDLDRLVLLDLVGRDPSAVSVPEATFRQWRRASRSFTGLAAYDLSLALVSGAEGSPERLIGADVTADFFSVLGGRVALGGTFGAAAVRNRGEALVVISDGLWRRRFAGDPAVVGKTLDIGETAFTVVGVMSADFAFPLQVDLWYPADEGDGERSLRVFGRLAAGVSMEAAQRELAAIHEGLQRMHPTLDQTAHPRLEPLRTVDLDGARTVLETVLVGSYFLLLIGCANLATQLVAHALGRRKEIAARLSLGASRARIVRQLLTECLLLSLAGAGLAVLVARWLLDAALFSFAGLDFLPGFRKARLGPFSFGYLALVAVVTAALFGLAPALQLARTSINQAVKESGAGHLGGIFTRRLRDGLVITQVALAVLVTFGALTFGSLLERVQRHKGFDDRDLASASLELSPARYSSRAQTSELAARLLGGLRVIPGVTAAALVNPEPYAEQAHKQPVTISGATSGRAYRRLVAGDVERTLGVPLLRGRMLGDGDSEDAPAAAVVSRAFVRAFLPPGAEPLGRRLAFAGDAVSATILGVIEDVEQIPGRGMEPTVYLPLRQWAWSSATVLARTDGDRPVAVDLRRVLQASGPGLFVGRVAPFDRFVRDRLTGHRLLAGLTALFAVMALLIAALGLNGVTGFLVAARTNELGVRAAMGASPSGLLRFVLARSLLLTALGLALGVAATVPAARLLERDLYSFGAGDPRVMGLAAAAVLVVATVAALIPGLRASRLRPLTALRYE